MKKSRFLLSVVVGASSGLLASCSSKPAVPPPQQAPASVWSAALIPCAPRICGGFPQNPAALGLESGEVRVASSGTVTVRMRRLSLGTAFAANKTLEAYLGSFTTGVFETPFINLLGTITTDAQGNFDGPIRASSGAAFAFAPGTTASGQFVLNDPGIRSEFVTGFVIP